MNLLMTLEEIAEMHHCNVRRALSCSLLRL